MPGIAEAKSPSHIKCRGHFAFRWDSGMMVMEKLDASRGGVIYTVGRGRISHSGETPGPGSVVFTWARCTNPCFIGGSLREVQSKS
jgi:hypothetical protein